MSLYRSVVKLSTVVPTFWWFLIEVWRITVKFVTRFLIIPINGWSWRTGFYHRQLFLLEWRCAKGVSKCVVSPDLQNLRLFNFQTSAGVVLPFEHLLFSFLLPAWAERGVARSYLNVTPVLWATAEGQIPSKGFSFQDTPNYLRKNKAQPCFLITLICLAVQIKSMI